MAAPAPPTPAPAYQELRGAMQALEAAALAGAQINISQIKGDERLAAELGVEQRALSEFVENLKTTAILEKRISLPLVTLLFLHEEAMPAAAADSAVELRVVGQEVENLKDAPDLSD